LKTELRLTKKREEDNDEEEEDWGGTGKFISLNVRRQCPLVLLMRVSQTEGRIMGSEKM